MICFERDFLRAKTLVQLLEMIVHVPEGEAWNARIGIRPDIGAQTHRDRAAETSGRSILAIVLCIV
jgi:hypothetical protein